MNHFDLSDRELAIKVYEERINCDVLGQKTRSSLKTSLIHFRKHHEERFWTKCSLKVHTEEVANRAGLRMQEVGECCLDNFLSKKHRDCGLHHGYGFISFCVWNYRYTKGLEIKILKQPSLSPPQQHTKKRKRSPKVARPFNLKPSTTNSSHTNGISISSNTSNNSCLACIHILGLHIPKTSSSRVLSQVCLTRRTPRWPSPQWLQTHHCPPWRDHHRQRLSHGPHWRHHRRLRCQSRGC